MSETIDYEWLKTKTEFANILRWEDDGGQTYEPIAPKIYRLATIKETEAAKIHLNRLLSTLIDKRRTS